MDRASIINQLFDNKCIKFGQFKLKSGVVAPFYINLRKLPLYPELFGSIVSLLVDELLQKQDHETDNLNYIVCGVPYGAFPIATAVAIKTHLPYLFLRQEVKNYGDPESLVEDFQGDNQGPRTVILIEDVVSSGQSILEALKAVEEQNLKVDFALCVVDREVNGLKLLLDNGGIRVFPIFKISEISEVLKQSGRISTEQNSIIRDWIRENQFKSIGK